ncbi:MAG: Sec-independent protein translocase protein TatB [Sideroxydans sp.]
MFDIGFSEILVIMVVALVVIGPERLPKVARSMGQWWGRTQRYLNKIKQDVNSSIQMEELREAQSKVQAAAGEMERSLHDTGSEINHSLAMLEKELENPVKNPAKDAAPPEHSPHPADRT